MTEGAGLLRARLELVLATDDPGLKRLVEAQTSVCFNNLDQPSASVTLLLDRDPPQLAPAGDPAEITIELNAEQFELFASGSLALAPSLLTGEVAFRGPVRRYLAVDPVLRSLLVTVAKAGAVDTDY